MLEKQPVTVGTLANGAPFRVNPEAIVMTTCETGTRYWIPPEAVLSSHPTSFAYGHVVHAPSYLNVTLVVEQFTNPESIIVVQIEPEEVIHWNTRMLQVEFKTNRPFAGPMLTYSSIRGVPLEDKIAELATELSERGVVFASTSDVEMWMGGKPQAGHRLFDEDLYASERTRVGVAMLHTPHMPFEDDRPNTPHVKLASGAIIKAILDAALKMVAHSGDDKEFVRVYHAAMAYYTILIRGGSILPRQYAPAMFDAIVATTRSFSSVWNFSMKDTFSILGIGNLPLVFENNPVDDAVVVFDEEDSMRVAEAHGGGRHEEPDVEFVCGIVLIKDEDMVVMDTETLVEYMSSLGVKEDLSFLDNDTRYSFFVNTRFTNSAFREAYAELFENDPNEGDLGVETT